MKRKIIKQGHNTLTVTLPSDWTKRFNLKAGSEIDILEKENGLFMTTEKVGDQRKAEFDISNMEIPTIWKYLMGVYREGYTEIKLNFHPETKIENPFKYYTQHRLDSRYKRESQKKSIVEAINGFVTRFIGFEIVEHGKDYVIIKEMGELTSKEFDNALRRVFLILEQMAEETKEAIEKNDHSIVEHMHDIDINLDKFHDYCIRILNRIGNKDQRKTSLLFSMLYILELIGDEFKNISHHLRFDFPDIKFEKTLKISASLVHEQVKNFYELFYKFDGEKIKALSKVDQDIYFNLTKSGKDMPWQEREIHHHLRIINRLINSVVELRIEMEF